MKIITRSLILSAILGLSAGTLCPNPPTTTNSTDESAKKWAAAQAYAQNLAVNILFWSVASYGVKKLISWATAKPQMEVANNLPDRMSDIKGPLPEEVNKLLNYFKNPNAAAAYTRFNRIPARKMLLYGDPGTGKTQLARSIAGELGIPYFALSASKLLNGWVGGSENNIMQVFEKVRAAAQKSEQKMALLFIDEFDGISMHRGGAYQASNHNSIIGTLLSELDGFEQNNKNIIVIAATNKKELIDSALIRPGRLTPVKVGLPETVEHRKAILEHYLSKQPYHYQNSPKDKDALLTRLAERTNGKSPAQLKDYIERACDEAIKQEVLWITDSMLVDIVEKDLKRRANQNNNDNFLAMYA